MKPILLTKPNCDKCDYVKARMPKIDLEIVDLTTPRGMALDVRYDLKGNKMPIVIHEDTPHYGAISALKKLRELEQTARNPESQLPK